MSESLQTQWLKRNKSLQEKKKESQNPFEFTVLKYDKKETKKRENKKSQNVEKTVPAANEYRNIPFVTQARISAHESSQSSKSSSRIQSPKSSSQSSRVQSPIIIKKAESPVKPTKPAKKVPKRTKIVIAALMAVAAILTVVIITFDKNRYCDDSYAQDECRVCPENAQCGFYTFDCNENYVYYDGFCVRDDLYSDFVNLRTALHDHQNATINTLIDAVRGDKIENIEEDIMKIHDMLEMCTDVAKVNDLYILGESKVVYYQHAFLLGIWSAIVVLVVVSCKQK
jgi:hypothetical protein